MFEVGFSELVMIGLVALLVLGPEKLPKAARELGFWLGRARQITSTVKAEIQQEFHAEELRQLLQQQLAQNELQQVADEAEHAVAETLATVNNPFKPILNETDDHPA